MKTDTVPALTYLQSSRKEGQTGKRNSTGEEPLMRKMKSKGHRSIKRGIQTGLGDRPQKTFLWKWDLSYG